MNKRILIGLLTAAALGFGHAPATAQTITYNATVTGVFDQGGMGTQTGPIGNNTQVQLLTYTGGSFSIAVDGTGLPGGGIGGQLNPDPNNTGSFGEISVLKAPKGDTITAVANEELTLKIDFSAPTVGGNPKTFEAIVKGFVKTSNQLHGANSGNLEIGCSQQEIQVNAGGCTDLEFSPLVGTFTNGDNGESGTFMVQLKNQALPDGTQHVLLTGTIETTAISPEPASLALILPGLIPLGLGLRRRRRTS